MGESTPRCVYVCMFVYIQIQGAKHKHKLNNPALFNTGMSCPETPLSFLTVFHKRYKLKGEIRGLFKEVFVTPHRGGVKGLKAAEEDFKLVPNIFLIDQFYPFII